jgi:hypothetical protein
MILGLRTYSVQRSARAPLLDFMKRGLEAAGCRIRFASEPTKAPFVVTFETATGERWGVVAYAFAARRTPTENRPEDERSFQIKYGNKDDYRHANSHRIWQDPLGLFTTIFLGIDPAENYFVAADPEMHNPTKFFIRLEFKDRHVEEIKRHGWHAWERAHRGTRNMTEPVEVLVGGTLERFFDLVRFERAAQGLDQGNRQLLAERPELFSWTPSGSTSTADVAPKSLHPLADELNLTPDEILEVIAGARRLKMAVRGWVAEKHLLDLLLRTDGVTSCRPLNEEPGADLLVSYRGGAPLTVECKNVLRVRNTLGLPRMDFQRTRASKANPCSRYYAPSDFDVVAACLHAVTEEWEFRYTLPMLLPKHRNCVGKLASAVVVDSEWMVEPDRIFEAAYAARG